VRKRKGWILGNADDIARINRFLNVSDNFGGIFEFKSCEWRRSCTHVINQRVVWCMYCLDTIALILACLNIWCMFIASRTLC